MSLYPSYRHEQLKRKLGDVQFELERHKIARLLDIPYARKRVVFKECPPPRNGFSKFVSYAKYAAMLKKLADETKKLDSMPTVQSSDTQVQCRCGYTCMLF